MKTERILILALDFDGVLHAPGQPDFFLLPKLESVLRDFPHVRVLIASSWREDRPLEWLRGVFSENLQYRVIGVTPVMEADTPIGSRQIEVEAFLHDNGLLGLPWLALDDTRNFYSPGFENLVLCDYLKGLDAEAEERLREKIALIGLASTTESSTVLTEAVVNVATRLDLSATDLQRILGISQPSASRLMNGAYQIREQSKEWGPAALLVRLYRGLYSIVGNDQLSRDWLRSPNQAFGQRAPYEIIQNAGGLAQACDYVDAHRAAPR